MAGFLGSFVFVLLAEMGDKTQLLAMAFAARYSAYKVLIAVFLATAINHFLAVLVGRFLTTIVPLETISLLAAFSFIIFGLWTIKGDSLHGEDKRESPFGAIATVGIAFFLAEMGDKTQLATIALAVKYNSMLNVLLGTTLAMVVADAIGIVVGVVLRKHIPKSAIKWVSAGIFVLFGLLGVYKILSEKFEPPMTFLIMTLVCCFTVSVAYFVGRKRPS